MNENLSIFKENIDKNPHLYILPYEKLVEYLDTAQNLSEPLSTAYEYTSDVKGLFFGLNELHSQINDRSTKNRLTRILNRLKEQFRVPEELSQPNSQTQI